MLPARNLKDFDDIPEEARNKIQFVWLERVEEAVETALEAKLRRESGALQPASTSG